MFSGQRTFSTRLPVLIRVPPLILLISSRHRTEDTSWPGMLSLRAVTTRGLQSSAQPDNYSGSTPSLTPTASTAPPTQCDRPLTVDMSSPEKSTQGKYSY